MGSAALDAGSDAPAMAGPPTAPDGGTGDPVVATVGTREIHWEQAVAYVPTVAWVLRGTPDPSDPARLGACLDRSPRAGRVAAGAGPRAAQPSPRRPS